MKSIGELLQEARKRKRLSAEELSAQLGLDQDTLVQWEKGDPELEKWGKVLANIAIELSVPTSRLIAETGRSVDARPGQCGALIRTAREKRQISPQELAEKLGLAPEEYSTVDAGSSPLEIYGPALLKIAEAVDLPVFNLLFGY